MKCFYHSSDMDGWCSAAIVARSTNNYNKEDYIGINHDSNKIENYDSIENEVIYIVDISFTENTMNSLLKLIKNNDVIWIDHHDASIELIEKYPQLKQIKGLRSKEHSAAYNTWLYLYKEKEEIPYSVLLVSDWDCFRFIFHDTTRYFKYGIDLDEYFSYPLSTQWKILLDDNTNVKTNELVAKGRIVDKYVTIENKKYCNANVYVSELDGYKCAVLNRSGSSLLFGDLYSEYPLVSTFVFDGLKYKYSLYSSNPDVDCNKIANKFGGGGHKGAAGFTSDKLIFPCIEKINNKKE